MLILKKPAKSYCLVPDMISVTQCLKITKKLSLQWKSVLTIERYDKRQQTSLKMMDYIFYRVYWAYNKKGESAKFLSLLYMTMVFAFLFYPFALFLCELLRDSYHRNDETDVLSCHNPSQELSCQNRTCSYYDNPHNMGCLSEMTKRS